MSYMSNISQEKLISISEQGEEISIKPKTIPLREQVVFRLLKVKEVNG